MKLTSKALPLFLFSLLGLGVVACTTTKQPRASSIQYSGFLRDYSQLEKGRKNYPVLSYVKPGLSLANYHSLWVEPPVIYLSKESLKKLKREDIERVVGFAYEGGRSAMGGTVKIVQQPGPGVMRIRWAITELQPASKMNIVTGVVWQAQLAQVALSEGTDTHLFVGRISVEFEILDSLTGEVLMSGIDSRVGSNAIQNVGSTWGDVQDAFKLWGERFLENLTDLGFKTQAPRS